MASDHDDNVQLTPVSALARMEVVIPPTASDKAVVGLGAVLGIACLGASPSIFTLLFLVVIVCAGVGRLRPHRIGILDGLLEVRNESGKHSVRVSSIVDVEIADDGFFRGAPKLRLRLDDGKLVKLPHLFTSQSAATAARLRLVEQLREAQVLAGERPLIAATEAAGREGD